MLGQRAGISTGTDGWPVTRARAGARSKVMTLTCTPLAAQRADSKARPPFKFWPLVVSRQSVAMGPLQPAAPSSLSRLPGVIGRRLPSAASGQRAGASLVLAALGARTVRTEHSANQVRWARTARSCKGRPDTLCCRSQLDKTRIDSDGRIDMTQIDSDRLGWPAPQDSDRLGWPVRHDSDRLG